MIFNIGSLILLLLFWWPELLLKTSTFAHIFILSFQFNIVSTLLIWLSQSKIKILYLQLLEHWKRDQNLVANFIAFLDLPSPRVMPERDQTWCLDLIWYFSHQIVEHSTSSGKPFFTNFVILSISPFSPSFESSSSFTWLPSFFEQLPTFMCCSTCLMDCYSPYLMS